MTGKTITGDGKLDAARMDFWKICRAVDTYKQPCLGQAETELLSIAQLVRMLAQFGREDGRT